MAIKDLNFAPASFGRISSGSSFTNTLRQEKQDEENRRRYEIAQARLAEQDAIAAADRKMKNEMLVASNERAQTTFNQQQEDKALNQKALEMFGSTNPVSPYVETTTESTKSLTPGQIADIRSTYQGEAGNDLLGADPRAKVIEQRLAELTPQIANAPVQPGSEQIANMRDSITPSGFTTAGGALSTAMQIPGVVSDMYEGAKNWYDGTTPEAEPVQEPTLSPYDIKKEEYDAGQKEFDKLTMEYAQLDNKLRDKKGTDFLSEVGTSYTESIKETMPRTAQGFRKAQIDAINKTLDENNVAEKDRAGIRSRMLKDLDPRAIEQGKIATQYRKDMAAKQQAEIAAAAEVQKNATTQREKSNSAYYKQQEADLKRLDNERLTMAKLYSDNPDNKRYLAEDAKIKAQQQRIRDTLKKQ